MDRISPLEIERTELPRRPLGYDRTRTDDLLRRCAEEIDRLRSENHSLTEQVAGLTRELDVFRSQEACLKDVLVVAQRAADETRATAHREAEFVRERALDAANTAQQNAESELFKLRYEIERLERERVNAGARIRGMLEELLRGLDAHVPSRAVAEIDLEVAEAG